MIRVVCAVFWNGPQLTPVSWSDRLSASTMCTNFIWLHDHTARLNQLHTASSDKMSWCPRSLTPTQKITLCQYKYLDTCLITQLVNYSVVFVSLCHYITQVKSKRCNTNVMTRLHKSDTHLHKVPLSALILQKCEIEENLWNMWKLKLQCWQTSTMSFSSSHQTKTAVIGHDWTLMLR